MNKKYVITLAADERQQLDQMVSKGKAPARPLTRAWVLLKADAGPDGPAWTDEQIHQTFSVGVAPELTVRGRNGLKFEEFADRPNVVSPASGHCWRPLEPLLALLLPPTQAAVLGAEVVHAPHQVHPLLQPLPLMHQPPPSPRQGRQAGPEGRVQPLDVRGVDLLARPRLLQLPLDLLRGATQNPPDHFHQAPARVPLDYLPQPDAARQAKGGPSRSPRPHLLPERTPARRGVTGQPIDADQQRRAGDPGQSHHVH